MFAKSEKKGATVEDMLYELLKFGQELTTHIESLEVAGGKVFAIHDRKMLFVLESFTEAMIVPLVEMKPREIIAIDGVFNDSDMLKTNLTSVAMRASASPACETARMKLQSTPTRITSSKRSVPWWRCSVGS